MKIPDDLINILLDAPDSQLDASLKPQIELWRDKEGCDIIDDVRSVIADCVNYSLASGFVLMVLQVYVYKNICGGNLEDAVGKIHCTELKND